MSIYSYEEAFGCYDVTSKQMRQAIGDWYKLYYGQRQSAEAEPCQRIAYTVVSKLVRAVFGEYKVSSTREAVRKVLDRVNEQAKSAMELAMVGGSCFIKPCPGPDGFSFALIGRANVLIFGRDEQGRITDLGTVERSIQGKYYYTLLERRQVDEKGYLTITNKLFRSLNAQSLGVQISLEEYPHGVLAEYYRYEEPVWSVGLAELKMPMLNCVDGSADGISIYGPAVELISLVDENEAQLRGEFQRGQSRVFASADLLKGDQGLQDHLFVGLDDDPESVGITVFSPQLRYQAYLERKQEYLRNVESIVGLKRGMLSDANAEERTATEITSSAGDFNLTVIDLQRAWEKTLNQLMGLCAWLGRVYGLGNVPEHGQFSIDWGNGVLYDEDQMWADYRQMVSDGLIKPEIALGWRFNMPVQTSEDLKIIREKWMP